MILRKNERLFLEGDDRRQLYDLYIFWTIIFAFGRSAIYYVELFTGIC